jgi:hypothetical protein
LSTDSQAEALRTTEALQEAAALQEATQILGQGFTCPPVETVEWLRERGITRDAQGNWIVPIPGGIWIIPP